jgi:carbamoyltransferase
LNCVANGRLAREGPFERLWIQPAAGDAGGAVGVALLAWHQLMDNARAPRPRDSQRGSLLGPRFDLPEVRAFLDSVGASYVVYEDDALIDTVAGLLAGEKVVGWFQGRMEFGPRALGSRSILGDARSPTMQSVMNRKIKLRESFRPFAPAVLEEHAHEYFEAAPGQPVDSPYMLLCAHVRADKRVGQSGDVGEKGASEARGLGQLGLPRSVVPAITHVDHSARVQTVDAQRNSRYHSLIKRFYEKTGCPVIINTSFNVRGEPLVCSPKDAFRCFMATQMDALVLDRCVLVKGQQAGAAAPRDPYWKQLAPD